MCLYLELFWSIFSRIWTEYREVLRKNVLDNPDTFRIFLRGGAGIEKSVSVKLITEQLKKILKQPEQDLENEPSALVTESTGKAAINIDQHQALTID